jgi:ABC-type sugar transport system substrate-binding protein
MRINARLIIFSIIAMLLLLSTGCAKVPEISNNKEGPSQITHKKIVLGFSQIGEESDWRTANTQSVMSAAKEAGVEVLFSNAQQKQENQIKAIRSFIAQQVDIIAFSPIVETGWDSVLLEAKEAGIPVIILDRAIQVKDKSLYTTHIGSDFFEEGRKAGTWLLQKHINSKEDVNVVELKGTADSSPTIGRTDGFKQIVESSSNIRVIDSQNGDFLRSKGKEVMERFLDAHQGKIDVIYSHNDDMALGAIQAIEEHGLKPGVDIKIVSVDAVRAAFEAMISGKINCSVECNPLQGPQLMKTVLDIADGKTVPRRIVIEEGIFEQGTAAKELPKRKY